MTTTKQKQAGAYADSLRISEADPIIILANDERPAVVARCNHIADAREIVRRYNTHPLLLEACKTLLVAKEKLVSFDDFVKQFYFGQDYAQENALNVIAAATATEGKGKENL